MKILLFFFILFLLIYPAQAGLTDTASEAVAKGFEKFIISTADSIFSISVSGEFEQLENENSIVASIYNIATWTPDPSRYNFVNQFIDFSKDLFADLYRLILLFTILLIFFTFYKLDAATKLEEITGINVGTDLSTLVKKAVQGIIIAVFMYTGIYFILLLNDALSKAIMLQSFDYIVPSPDNYILYLVMAIAYLLMCLFFAARILIIFLFYMFAFLIGACLLIDYTRPAATSACAYFVQTVFFQFIIVTYFTVSIMIIDALNLPTVGGIIALFYLAMLIGGFLLGIKLMLGTSVVKWVGRVVLTAI